MLQSFMLVTDVRLLEHHHQGVGLGLIKKLPNQITKLEKIFGRSQITQPRYFIGRIPSCPLSRPKVCIGISVTRSWNKTLPKFSKSCLKISHSSFYYKGVLFLIAQKVTYCLGYLCRKICFREIYRTAQFGHTDRHFSWSCIRFSECVHLK